MKKFISLITVFFCLLQFIRFSAQAQILYGTTFNGGTFEGGTITKFIPGTNNLIVAKSLESNAGSPFYTHLIQASDGKLYGMTAYGGYGAIFSFAPATSTYTIVKGFDHVNGAHPKGSLMQAKDGKLYGMTSEGGRYGAGVIFSFDPASSNYIKLKDFNGTDGESPYGSLMQATDGKLYGMTTYGGSKGVGVLFSFDPSSLMYTKLKNFDNSSGAKPYGGLMQAGNGTIYGTTASGGKYDAGVIFSLDPSSSVFVKLASFNGNNGAAPYGSLVQTSDGKLYGLTVQGGKVGGVIFSFDPASLSITKLADFDFPKGVNPAGHLILANDGQFYGVTEGGGKTGAGVIFSFNRATSALKMLKDFSSTDASGPLGGLMQANDGKLYGMAGGGIHSGVLFSFDISSMSYKKLQDFGINKTGSNLSAALVQARNGILYGITSQGGSNGAGVIYSYDPSTSTYKKLKDLKYIDGANATGGLMQARDGKLYGMTSEGGTNRLGVIFSFNPSTSTYTKLKDFDNGYDNGAWPQGGFTEANDGKLYGMTSTGMIFSFDPSTSVHKPLKQLNRNSDGAGPYGNLLLARDGKLYGMTAEGGTNDMGVIFSFDPFSSVYTSLLEFDNSNGNSPYGSLIQADNGKLYGMTFKGGSDGYGVIFSYDPVSSVYARLKDFDNTNGGNPYGNLMQAKDGKLYGMTHSGGNNSRGVIFSFDPVSAVYTKLEDYKGANGANPYIGSAFIEVNECIANAIHYKDKDGDGYGDPADSTTVCPLPAGHVANNLDCNDNPATGGALINPTANELPGNNIDDNCNGFTDENFVAPAVTLTNPANDAILLTGANVYFTAQASDADGSIIKVAFYDGATLLYTTTDSPYTFKWQKVPKGEHTLTAKATDNDGVVTSSNPIHISVVPNKAPAISITNPVNNQVFTEGAIIHLQAAAQDADGRISKVEFYHGTKLLATELRFPYTYDWNVPTGNYIILAKATDNWGAVTVSAAITISVVPQTPPQVNLADPFNRVGLKRLYGEATMQLAPNPVTNTVTLYTKGFPNNTSSVVSVVSTLGVAVKKVRLAGSTDMVQLDVSSLVSGVYTVKLMNNGKIIYRQFVKL